MSHDERDLAGDLELNADDADGVRGGLGAFREVAAPSAGAYVSDGPSGVTTGPTPDVVGAAPETQPTAPAPPRSPKPRKPGPKNKP